jgi:hypothetical protein
MKRTAIKIKIVFAAIVSLLLLSLTIQIRAAQAETDEELAKKNWLTPWPP